MEGQDSKESIPSSSKPLFPLFPAVETVPSDKTEAGKWGGCIYNYIEPYLYSYQNTKHSTKTNSLYLPKLVGWVW